MALSYSVWTQRALNLGRRCFRYWATKILKPPRRRAQTVGRNNIATFKEAQGLKFWAQGPKFWAQGPNFGPRAQILGPRAQILVPWAQIWAQIWGAPGPGPFFSARIFFGNKDPDPHHADFQETVVPPGLLSLPRGCASKSLHV